MKDVEMPPDPALLVVDRLAAALRDFAQRRDWDQFHSPKNLVMALSAEVGELTEVFQWMSEAESRQAGRDPKIAPSIEQELADVTLYLVRLADVLGVDLDQAVRAKLASNEERYPVETSKGNSRKSMLPHPEE